MACRDIGDRNNWISTTFQLRKHFENIYSLFDIHSIISQQKMSLFYYLKMGILTFHALLWVIQFENHGAPFESRPFFTTTKGDVLYITMATFILYSFPKSIGSIESLYLCKTDSMLMKIDPLI